MDFKGGRGQFGAWTEERGLQPCRSGPIMDALPWSDREKTAERGARCGDREGVVGLPQRKAAGLIARVNRAPAPAATPVTLIALRPAGPLTATPGRTDTFVVPPGLAVLTQSIPPPRPLF